MRWQQQQQSPRLLWAIHRVKRTRKGGDFVECTGPEFQALGVINGLSVVSGGVINGERRGVHFSRTSARTPTSRANPRQAMPDVMDIKIAYREEFRRFFVPTGSKYAKIQHQASRAFGLGKATPIKLKYTDDEGDLITMSTDSELAYAIKHTTTPEKPALSLTLEVTNHTTAQLATRTAATRERPAVELVAQSPEGQAVAEQAAVPESQGALTAMPSGTIVKKEGGVPPMPPDAFVTEEGGAVAQSAITTLTTTADALALAPAEEDVPTASQPISPAAEKSAPATTTAAAVLPSLPLAPRELATPERWEMSGEAAAGIALAHHNMAASIAAIPESGAGPRQKPAGQKRKRDSAQLLEVTAFLASLGERPRLPPGWASEMVDRGKPYVDKEGKPSKKRDTRYSGPDKDEDKEGKPIWVKTVKHAWLLHGGFASSEHACQTLDKELAEAAAAAAAAAGAPGPSSDNGVDASDPKDAVPLGAAMDGTFALHMAEEVD